MVGSYDVTKGYNGFQEYQGSPREENIDGEPRVFRTYVGPAANRDLFLRYMFGATAFVDIVGSPDCLVSCANPKTYPRESWICQKVIGGVLYSQTVQPDYFLEPYSYRCEPWDSEQSYTLIGPTPETSGTLRTIGDSPDDLVPNVDCGVLIEIEYRLALQQWPANIHAPTHISTVNTQKPEYLKDVPVITRPTSVTIEHEYAIESRLLKGRQLEVVSFGSMPAKYPSAAAGELINDFTHDDVDPFTPVNIHTMNITMRNVPYLVDYDDVRRITGHVNNDVWFGYPAHAVYCAEVSPKPKYWVDGRIYYDVSYTFVARWVPTRGEEPGWVAPLPSPTIGIFVFDGKIGIWNRSWWEFAIPGTNSYWWPITYAGKSIPNNQKAYDQSDNLVPEINFHLGFNWWENICGEVE